MWIAEQQGERIGSIMLVDAGDRVAQLVIQRFDEVAWNVVDSLDGIDRGGGFGHSGR